MLQFCDDKNIHAGDRESSYCWKSFQSTRDFTGINHHSPKKSLKHQLISDKEIKQHEQKNPLIFWEKKKFLVEQSMKV